MKTKAVVKRADAVKRVFKGVSLDSLAVGEKSMVTKMNYVKGNFADTHSPRTSSADMSYRANTV